MPPKRASQSKAGGTAKKAKTSSKKVFVVISIAIPAYSNEGIIPNHHIKVKGTYTTLKKANATAIAFGRNMAGLEGEEDDSEEEADEYSSPYECDYDADGKASLTVELIDRETYHIRVEEHALE